MKAANLKYIDNGFYRITKAQAKRVSVDGKLPRIGYQKAVELEKLRGFNGIHGEKSLPLFNAHLRSAWIQETRVGSEMVLAIMVYYAPYPTW